MWVLSCKSYARSSNLKLQRPLQRERSIFAYFFVPVFQRLKSERLYVAQLQEKLAKQRQTIEEFQYPTEEEKHSWNDSKQRLKTTYLLPNDELTKEASYCGITGIVITPQSMSDRLVAPAEGLPSNISENKSLLKISFHADYESLGKFLKWFDDHPQQTSILSLNVKRGFPLLSAEMEVEVSQYLCDF